MIYWTLFLIDSLPPSLMPRLQKRPSTFAPVARVSAGLRDNTDSTACLLSDTSTSNYLLNSFRSKRDVSNLGTCSSLCKTAVAASICGLKQQGEEGVLGVTATSPNAIGAPDNSFERFRGIL